MIQDETSLGAKSESDAVPTKHVEIKTEMNFSFIGFSFRN